ncbi:MAG: hypothetical protein K2Y07_07940 [Nitrosomonas sp.]|nr:hypothetical protein [Nitrosomonas sp.]
MQIFITKYLAIGITVLLASLVFSQRNAHASDYPIFRDGKLIIPRVDTAEQTGRFQNVELQLSNGLGTNFFTLLNYQESIVTPEKGVYIDKVETIITDSSPMQVFVKVTGSLPNPCYSVGQINRRLKDGKFEIALHSVVLETFVACPEVLVSFEKIIPLEVYGLSAGNYEYQVNGDLSGSFSLAADNNL